MSDEPIQLEARGTALVITLNRPEALNAQNQALRNRLVDAIDRLDSDPGFRVGILRGAGRAFSAGADIKESVGDAEAPGELERAARFRHFVRLDAARKPVIAVIHGWALGGGLELALCCDLRVATVDARLGLPEPRSIGAVAGVAVHRLTGMIPAGEALRLLLTADPLDAGRAHAIGLVQELAADADAAMDVAFKLADQIAQCDPDAVAATKQIARSHLTPGSSPSGSFPDLTGGRA